MGIIFSPHPKGEGLTTHLSVYLSICPSLCPSVEKNFHRNFAHSFKYKNICNFPNPVCTKVLRTFLKEILLTTIYAHPEFRHMVLHSAGHKTACNRQGGHKAAK